MKKINPNFSLGGGYFFQWWVGVLIHYFSENTVRKNKIYSESIWKIRDLISKGFKKGDIFVEGHGECFEDINLLKIEKNKTKILFFQVKGGDEIDKKNGEKSKKSILKKELGEFKILKNFFKNQNINSSKKNKFIVVGNKHFNKNFIKIIEKNDKDYIYQELINKINIEETEIKLSKKIKEVIRLVVLNNNDGKKEIQKIINSDKSLKEYLQEINKIFKIINLIKIIPYLKVTDLTNFLFEKYGEDKAKIKFYNFLEKSIDISKIEKTDERFLKYKDYSDLNFLPYKKIKDLEENGVIEGKFI